MTEATRAFTRCLQLVVVAAAITAPTAHAWPFRRLLHLHPAAARPEDTSIRVRLFNQGILFQDVQVEGRVYTVMAHESLMVRGPEGTAVYAASTGMGHRKGDLLFAIKPEMKGKVIAFN